MENWLGSLLSVPAGLLGMAGAGIENCVVFQVLCV